MAEESPGPEHATRRSSTTEGLPVAPSLGPGLAAVHIGPHAANVTSRTAWVCPLAVALAVVAAGVPATAPAPSGATASPRRWSRSSTTRAGSRSG